MKNTTTVATVIAVLLLAGCAPRTPETPEQQFVNDAIAAIGGRSKVEAAQALTIRGEGVNYNLGQDMRPEAATQTFAITEYERQVDLANSRQRVTQIRTPKFAYFQGPQPQKQIQSVDGAVAFNGGDGGPVSRAPARAELDRRTEFFHHPLTTLHAALQPTTTVSNVRNVGVNRQADFKSADLQWTMTIDAAGVPLSVSSKTYHPNLGDVAVTTTFAQYVDVGGLKLPAQLRSKVDEFTTWELTVTKQELSAAGPLTAPDSVAKPAPAAAAPNVTAEAIGKGVWFLAGQSHHSVLIEFGDHLMLIEAPQSEARALAVIAKAKSLVPGKPLTQLVTTHHHFDHTAGMRAAIYSGLTVITQAGNKDWVDNMARRPHTIEQDMLAKNVSRLNVETVDAEREYTDQSMTVRLYHVAGNPHSDTMLMAYLPRYRTLIEVDAFSPGSAVNPYAANLLENIQKHKLAVDKIVPLHGTIAPFAELVKVAGAKTN